MKKIILIKFGGSLITEKDKAYTARLDVIEQLTEELRLVIEDNSDTQFILGTGAGSFGHYPVVKHNLKAGIAHASQLIGFGEVNDGVTKLNSFVVESLLQKNIPACAVNPSSIFTAKDEQLSTASLDSFFGMLKLGIMPVVYGNIIYDSVKGCSIFSTERIFEILIDSLLEKNFVVKKVIHLSIVDGVLDAEKKIIPLIEQNNFAEIQNHLYKTEGYDVTGGMLHKIEESLSLAKKGIKTHIANGQQKQVLSNILAGENVGTSIQ